MSGCRASRILASVTNPGRTTLIPLKRLSIPELAPRPVQPGAAGIVQRSFRYGQQDFLRHFRDEPLALTVTLNGRESRPANAIVALHTNIGTRQPDQWQDLRFETSDGHTFQLHLPLPRCGLFSFRVKYSFDGGQQWYWDRVPYSYVLVDPPSLRTVRLYTLIPSASGTITDWTARLPAIASMGFNAIHLLPITVMGNSQSPYSARQLFDIDPRYRDPAARGSALDQFENFVTECRRLNVRLCLDLVLNHIAVDSDMAAACPDWIIPDDSEPNGLKRAGCWHLQDWIRWEDLVPIHYDHPNVFIRNDIWGYMTQYALFWSNYASYTGGMVRFDNLHSSFGPFIADLSASIRREFPELPILGEYFTDELTLEKTVPEWGVNLLLANTWEHPFCPSLRHYIQYLHKVSGRLRHLCSITTHDTGVPAALFGADCATLPRYAVCALFTMGQTGLVQGVEHGIKQKLAFIGPSHQPDFTGGPDYRPFISRINALLAEHAAFRHAGNITFVDRGHEAILGAYRASPAPSDSAFLLFANLDIYHPQHISPNLAACHLTFPLQLRDALTGATIILESAAPEFTLEPCGVRVLEIPAGTA